MILALTTYAKSARLNTREDHADKLSKGGRVEWYNALSSATSGVLRVHSVTGNRGFRGFAYSTKPDNVSEDIAQRILGRHTKAWRKAAWSFLPLACVLFG